MGTSELRMANSEWKKNSEMESPFATRQSQFAAAVVTAARSWIGTSYVHQASVKGIGCDCLGLLRGVWRELYGDEPEVAPPYSPDWAEATREETLYGALKRHLVEIDPPDVAPGDVALFRMLPNGPAKHCGIVGYFPPPRAGEGDHEVVEGARANAPPPLRS